MERNSPLELRDSSTTFDNSSVGDNVNYLLRVSYFNSDKYYAALAGLTRLDKMISAFRPIAFGMMIHSLSNREFD
jgi:hypothetical protein